MKKLFFASVAAMALCCAAVAWAQQQNRLAEFPSSQAWARAGACLFPAGGWTIVDCSNVASATSSALSQWSRYVLQCTDDSYVTWGAAGVSANTSQGYLPNGAWVEFMTSYDVRYLACRNRNVDADCRYIECL